MVDLADMRSFDTKRLTDYDLILIGSPVFYYDIPIQCQRLVGRDAEDYGNARGGVCIFRRAGRQSAQRSVSYPSSLNRSGGHRCRHGCLPQYSRISDARPGTAPNQRSGEHLPNEATYEQVRRFTGQILAQVSRGEAIAL